MRANRARRRWRILARLPHRAQLATEFILPDRVSIRYYRGRKVLYAWVNMQLYFLFLEMSRTDQKGVFVV